MYKLFNFLKQNCNKASVEKQSENKITIDMSSSQINDISFTDDTKFIITAITDSGCAVAVTSDETDIQAAVNAIENSKICIAQQSEIWNFPLNHVNCYDKFTAQLTAQEISQEAKRISEYFEIRGIKTNIKIFRSVYNISAVNTEGFDGHYKKTNFGINIETVSEKGFGQVRYNEIKTSFFRISDEELDELCTKHNTASNIIEIENGRYDVIFTQNAAGSVLSRLVFGFDAEKISAGTSKLSGKIGQKIFSENFTLRDDGTVDWAAGSLGFDSQCAPSQNTVLVKNGIAVNMLANAQTAKKLNINPTGNCIRGNLEGIDITRQAVINPTNLIVEPGIDDASLYSMVKKGLLAETVLGGHTGDFDSGDFILTSVNVYYIEDGKIIGKVNNIQLIGNVYKDLSNIKAVGTKQHMLSVTSHCIGYSPAILIENVLISKENR